MKLIALSPAAEADLEAIWDHSARHWGSAQADRYVDDVRDACLALAEGRRVGRPVDIRPPYLKYAVGAHMLYFRVEADRLEIIRILHQRQDVSRNMSDQ